MSQTMMEFALKLINDAVLSVAPQQRLNFVRVVNGVALANLICALGSAEAIESLKKSLAMLEAAEPTPPQAHKLGGR